MYIMEAKDAWKYHDPYASAEGAEEIVEWIDEEQEEQIRLILPEITKPKGIRASCFCSKGYFAGDVVEADKVEFTLTIEEQAWAISIHLRKDDYDTPLPGIVSMYKTSAVDTESFEQPWDWVFEDEVESHAPVWVGGQHNSSTRGKLCPTWDGIAAYHLATILNQWHVDGGKETYFIVFKNREPCALFHEATID